ncbi:hypothetical protein RhiirA1_459670 [Rhizophagus irregularis]|uniref:Polymerase nucleotidyl transferase domain-containing protein n=1 Tax=Rhizophagus irregularis TaxID=588596 RepID=A0A2N0RT57_9GLOM|nr:hypothetical protein RhiirA1_459670 [Rhizophagus irregularis]
MLEALKNVSNEQDRKVKLVGAILNILSTTPSQGLSYYANQPLYKQLGNYIANKIPKEADSSKVLSLIQRVISRCDFRLIEDYLFALETQDNYLVNLIESEINKPDFQQKVDHYRFQRLTKGNRTHNRKLILKDNPEALFSEETPGDIIAYVADPTLKNTFTSLFERSQGHLSEYIDTHHDLLGLYSLIRKGLVKSIQLNSDQFIVTKRDNPDKKGRFLTEQRNINRISDILNLKYRDSFVDLSDQSSIHKVRLKLIKPFAIFADKQQHKFYSLAYLQEGKTLEEVLLYEQDPTARFEHLKNSRKILDFLYEKGVIWGDMAPRNTIVNQMSGATDYYILDFEKTKILNHSASLTERQEHCRGQMCVEEFGAICSLEEGKTCFRGYFEPEKWDLNSLDPVPFEKPKRELVAIFEARGEEFYTLGAYNRLEQQVMKVRFPFTDGAKNKRHPLHICFKVDHYLGDLATATTYNTLQENRQCYEYDFLEEVINGFYDRKEEFHQFRLAINRYNTGLKLYHIRLDEVTKRHGISLAKSNCEALRTTLHRILKSAYANYRPTLILLSGGFSRGEITYGSDVDVGIVSDKDSSEIKKFIKNRISEELGLSSDFYLDVTLQDVEKRFLGDPSLLEDVLHGQIANGDSKAIQSYEQAKKRILQNKNYLATAVPVFIPKYQVGDETEVQIKQYLKLCNLTLALAPHVGVNINKGILLSIKDFLLFYKNEYAYEKSKYKEPNVLDEGVMSEIGLYLRDQSSALLAEIDSNGCFLLDNEIVETVKPNPSADDLQDEEEIIPVISLTEALINIENLINLHNFPLENFEVTNEELRILKGIRCNVLRYKSESSIQLSMDEFINFN